MGMQNLGIARLFWSEEEEPDASDTIGFALRAMYRLNFSPNDEGHDPERPSIEFPVQPARPILEAMEAEGLVDRVCDGDAEETIRYVLTPEGRRKTRRLLPMPTASFDTRVTAIADFGHRHVVAAARLTAKQRATVDELRATRQDSDLAADLLTQFERAHALMQKTMALLAAL